MRRGKIAGRHAKPVHQARVLQLLRLMFPFEHKRGHTDIARCRKRRGCSARFHSRNTCYPGNHATKEAASIFLLELRRRQADAEGESMRRINSDVSRL